MKFVLIACFILGVLMLAGCQPEAPAEDDGELQEAPVQQDKALDEGKVSDIQRMDTAINNMDPSNCDTIVDDNIKQGCYDRVTKVRAIDAKDLESCNKIQNAGIRNDCKNLVTQGLQNSGGTTPQAGTDCSQFTNPDEVQNCENLRLRAMALEQKDPSLCGGISDIELQDNCKNNVYQNLAIRDKDLTLCGKISIPALVEACENNVYSNKAFAEKNAALCDRITQDAMKQSCKSRLA